MVGFVLAMVLSITTHNLAYIEHNIFDEYDIEVINWHADSSLTLSSQISEYSHLLLSTSVVAGFTTESMDFVINKETGEVKPSSHNGFSIILSNQFALNASLFQVNYYSSNSELEYILKPDEGYMEAYTSVIIDNRDLTLRSPFNFDNLFPLHIAFAEDIANKTELADITSVDINQFAANLPEGSPYWELYHVYADGTLMEFKIMGTLMILRIIHLDHWSTSPNGGSMGPIWQDVVYPTFICEMKGDDILPTYAAAINAMILDPNQEVALEELIEELGAIQEDRGLIGTLAMTGGMILIMLGSAAINFQMGLIDGITNLWWLDNKLSGTTPWNPTD
jgi:hypothetical protein